MVDRGWFCGLDRQHKEREHNQSYTHPKEQQPKHDNLSTLYRRIIVK
jgi:hypothetical protein